jgi:formamidopyrimidine-DNA glycosylase
VPELPDVEAFRQVLARHGVGERIVHVAVLDPGVVRQISPRDFARDLTGRRFRRPERRGKWLVAPTDGPTLLVHFGMTGGLSWASPADKRERYDRVVLSLADGDLVYADQRKLRGLWLAKQDGEIAKVIGRQGPDAYGLTGAALTGALEGRRRSLKVALMDQSVIAGIGNMLADETLWRAKIHPSRRFDSLDTQERRLLDRALQQVLRSSIRAGTIPRTRAWLSSQRGLDHPQCPRGHGELRTSRLAGRTTYWCPTCQPSET